MFSALNSLTAFAAASVIVAAWQEPSVPTAPSCRASGATVRLSDLPEASGVAASRRSPGVFWAHNDTGDAVIYALDQAGTVTGRVHVTGASVEDWEDIAVGSCPQGSCLYVADIGDNDGKRKHITLYRVPEPRPGDASTAPAEVFHAVYPGGPHDAESLFVTKDGEVFIVTKGDPGSVALFRLPPPMKSGATVPLEQVGEPLSGEKVDAGDRPTAADMSPDGRWVTVRTTDWVAFYPAADVSAGRWREEFRFDVSSLREPRGEGITFAGGDSVVLVGEGGGLFRNAGTFARLACTLPRR